MDCNTKGRDHKVDFSILEYRFFQIWPQTKLLRFDTVILTKRLLKVHEQNTKLFDNLILY